MWYSNKAKIFFLSLALLSISFSGVAQSYEMFQAKQAFQDQEFQNVVTITTNILNRDSLNLQAHQLLASSLLAQKRVAEAGEAAENGLLIFPKSSSLLWVKAESLLQSGKADEALSIYQELKNTNSSLSGEMIRERLGLIYQSKGGMYYQQNKLDLAEENLKKSKSFLPDTIASYSNLALVYIKKENWDKALEVLDEGRDRFPENVDLQQIRANVLLENGKYDEVINDYKSLYQKSPYNLDIALPYAQLLMARGDKEKASEIYDDLIEHNGDQRRIYESLVEFYDNRDNQDAKRQALRKMQERFPEEISILKRIAQTYEKQEKWKFARAVYDSVQTMEGYSKSTSKAVAQIYIQENNLAAADSIYAVALSHSPYDEELLRLRGDLQQKAKQWKEAERTFKTLIETSNSSYGYSQLAGAQYELGKADSAFMNYKKATERGIDDPKTYLELSKLYVEKDGLTTSLEYGEQALRMSLEKVQELQEGIVQKLDGNQQLSEIKSTESEGRAFKEMNELAVSAFAFVTATFPKEDIMPLMNSLQQDYPGSGRLLYLISEYYNEQGMDQKAVSLLKESVRLAPNLAKAHKALGAYYLDSNNTVQAIRSYERARSAAPEDKEPYIRLIELYRQAGKLDQLCERWKAQFRANSDNQVLKEYLIAALHKAERYEEANMIIQLN